MALIDQHADRCVYPRPFPDGFDACPAFQATSFIAADSRNKPLGTWRTCRHLGTGNDLDTRGRFYPRCALGDEQQRLQWLAQVSPAKLDVVRALQDEFDQLSRPHRERLFDARARLHSGPASAQRERELEQLINGSLSTIDHFLEQNDERFRDVGLPAEPLRQLIKEWVWAWVRTPELATPRLDEKPLEVFDRPARAFLGAPIEPVVSAARRLWDRPLYSDTILQILPTVDPPGLALVGDVDRSNVAAGVPGPGCRPPPRAPRDPAAARSRAGDRRLGAAPELSDRGRRERMKGTVERFSHEALLYSDMDEYLDGTLTFIGEGLAASEPVLVVVGAPKIAALKARLGPDAGRVQFKNMADVGGNPARIIPACHAFVESHAGAGLPFRGIGEPIYPERSAAELVECQRHEALLNVAFDEGPAWRLLCPYNTTALAPDVVEEAHRSHPV